MTVTPVSHDFSGGNTTLRLGFFGDLQFGSSDFDSDLCKRDLDRAYESCAGVFLIGDNFDAIFPGDPRHAAGVRDGNREDPINEDVERFGEFLQPYADKLVGIGMGNHETACIRHNNVDPVRMLVAWLNAELGTSIVQMGYRGWIPVHLSNERAEVHRARIYWFHGAGGSAPKSKGMLNFSGLAAEYDFDVYICGHKHKLILDGATTRETLDRDNKPVLKRLWAAQTGTYKRIQKVDKGGGYRSNYGEERFDQRSSNGWVQVVFEVSGKSELESQVLLRGGIGGI